MSNNLIIQPLPSEGQRVEYKLTLTQPSILARVIASFANTEGGRIIIGVDDEGNIVGLTEETIAKAPKLIKQASQGLQPKPSLSYHIEEIDGKNLIVIEVQPYQAPIMTEDQRYYIRRGASNVLMEEDFIARLATAVPGLKSNVLKSFTLKDNDNVRPEKTRRSVSVSWVMYTEAKGLPPRFGVQIPTSLIVPSQSFLTLVTYPSTCQYFSEEKHSQAIRASYEYPMHKANKRQNGRDLVVLRT